MATAIAEPYGRALEAAAPRLVEELEAMAAAQTAGRVPEPELATPRPSGILAGLAPIDIIG